MNRLKEIRAVRRVTQFQLSLFTGIPQSKLSLIEGGLIFPTEVEKQRIAGTLRVTVDDIWDDILNEDAIKEWQKIRAKFLKEDMDVPPDEPDI